MTTLHHRVLDSPQVAPIRARMHPLGACDQVLRCETARDSGTVRVHITCVHGRSEWLGAAAEPESPRQPGKRCGVCNEPSGDDRLCARHAAVCGHCLERPRRRMRSGRLYTYCRECTNEFSRGRPERKRAEATA